jgi:hypothetical protein
VRARATTAARGGALVALAALAACSSSASHESATTTGPTIALTAASTSTSTTRPTTTTSSTTVAPTTTRPATTVAPAPATTSAPRATTPVTVATSSVSVATVSAADLGASWHAGCPVGPSHLRRVQLPYWGFDGRAHMGALVVNANVVDAVVSVFSKLFDAHFPIRRMVPVSAYGGSDDASMAADNTSAFNCRTAVASGPPRWSVHSYGEAIDVNTVENPYVFNGTVLPPAGAAYTNRANVRAGMTGTGTVVNQAFASVGWQWGGRWSDPDYQHFSATGG